MSRTEASDHADKRRKLLRQAARWFAEQGYDRASMSGLAVACGVSKGLLYHYFSSKDDILAAIIREHLSELLEALEGIEEQNPEAWLHAATRETLRAYEGADDQHQLQLQALGLLPDEEQKNLRELQRQIVASFSQRISDLRAGSNPHDLQSGHDYESELRALTMSLFGMLNWFYLWHRPGRDMDRDDYAKLCANLLIQGITQSSASSDDRGTGSRQSQRDPDLVYIPILDLSSFDPKKDS